MKTTPKRYGERARLSIDVTPEFKKKLETLCEATEKTTLTDLIKTSTKVFGLLCEHAATGGKTILRHADGREETIILIH